MRNVDATNKSRSLLPTRLLPADYYSAKWILGLLILQFACQLALIFEQLGSFRVIFRTAPFLTALFAFALVKGRRIRHPAQGLASLICLTVTAFIANSFEAGPVAAIASVAFYTAIISPVFWVTRLTVTKPLLEHVFFLLFIFHTVSSTFGVLQTKYPGRFQPALSTVVRDGVFGGDELKIQLADGSNMFRPMGLSDQPGGAGLAGFYAFVLGLGFLATKRSQTSIWLSVYAMLVGFFCIYMSQIRSLLILVVIVYIGFVAGSLLFTKRRLPPRVFLLIPAIGIVAFSLAVQVGGEQTLSRFLTLTSSNPVDVYYKNRGGHLALGFFEYLPTFPFGAGLGRWGMISHYFGRGNSIWAEVQWVGWIVDGGIPLVLLYAGAIVVCVQTNHRLLAITRDSWLSGWILLVLAYDIGIIFQTFSSVPFQSQSGLEFWLLNSLLFSYSVRNSTLRQLATARRQLATARETSRSMQVVHRQRNNI